MTFQNIQKEQGLYQPNFEHDACGIGFYASLKNEPTHDIVVQGLAMLCRLDHRAGRGSDGKTGDGAGLMVQIPDAFFRQATTWALPPNGEYGVGQLFFTADDAQRQQIEEKFNAVIAEEGQTLIGWRTAPTNTESLSETAKQTAPVVRQLFIASDLSENPLAFERKLYVIRKRVENWAKAQHLTFYCPSLSTQTMVFKGLLAPEEVAQFYVDLQHEQFTSAMALVHSRYSTNTFPSWEPGKPFM